MHHAVPQGCLDFVLGDLLAAQVFLEELVVVLADLLNQLLAIFLRFGQHLAGFRDDIVGALVSSCR